MLLRSMLLLHFAASRCSSGLQMGWAWRGDVKRSTVGALCSAHSVLRRTLAKHAQHATNLTTKKVKVKSDWCRVLMAGVAR